MRRGISFSFSAILLIAAGCGGKSAPVPRAGYDPERAAQAALDEFDKDRDGTLSAAELNACPGIKAAAARIDTNNDQKLSRDELKARFTTYADATFGVLGVTCTVTLGDSPVSGAVVTFTPESCFGDSLKSGSGTTDASGVVTVVRSDGVEGLSPGLYRVAVVGGGVPADYGSRPLLGHEVSADGRGDALELKLVAQPK